MRFSVTTYDDTGRVYLTCRECTWEEPIIDEDLESIVEMANEHYAQAHTA